MHRFFIPELSADSATARVTLSQEVRHLRDVLRLKAGAQILVFNGKGLEATARVEKVGAREVVVAVGLIKENIPGGVPVCLACAIPKKSKFEFIIEKCTELGVYEITPLLTKRTECVLVEQRIRKKQLRYQAVAVNASKQCCRSTLPRIHEITKFPDFLKMLQPDTLALIPCLPEALGDGNQRQALGQVSFDPGVYRQILFVIGPEGDFTPAEVGQAVQAGCVPVSLGSNILKVDTAALSVCAWANFLTSEL